MSRRRLSDEERALWAGYARTVAPLPTAPKRTEPAEPAAKIEKVAAKSPPGQVEREASRSPVVPSKKPPASAPPALAPLGRRLTQRVARGQEPIDARLDLHGMTQREAHARLLRFLRQAQADGARTVLIVTGKGSDKRRDFDDAGASRSGVLRQQVPQWLALPEVRALVIGFEDAHRSHGGEGALYVRIRRAR